jgi:hypothetical protein
MLLLVRPVAYKRDVRFRVALARGETRIAHRGWSG